MYSPRKRSWSSRISRVRGGGDARALFFYQECKYLSTLQLRIITIRCIRVDHRRAARKATTRRGLTPLLRHARATHHSPEPVYFLYAMAFAVKTAVRVNQMVCMLFAIGASVVDRSLPHSLLVPLAFDASTRTVTLAARGASRRSTARHERARNSPRRHSGSPRSIRASTGAPADRRSSLPMARASRTFPARERRSIDQLCTTLAKKKNQPSSSRHKASTSSPRR